MRDKSDNESGNKRTKKSDNDNVIKCGKKSNSGKKVVVEEKIPVYVDVLATAKNLALEPK